MHDTPDGFRIDLLDETTQSGLDDGIDRQRLRPRPLRAGRGELHVGAVRLPSRVQHRRIRVGTRGRRTPTTSRTPTRSATSSTARSSTQTSTARSRIRRHRRSTTTTSSASRGRTRCSCKINGCFASDDDFDGPSYQNDWPGTNPDVAADQRLHPEPVIFTSPTTNGGDPIPDGRVRSRPARTSSRAPATRRRARLRQPAAGLAVLSVLLHPQDRRVVRLAGGRAVHPRHDQRLRRQLRRSSERCSHRFSPSPGFTTVDRFENFNSGDLANPCTGK